MCLYNWGTYDVANQLINRVVSNGFLLPPTRTTVLEDGGVPPALIGGVICCDGRIVTCAFRSSPTDIKEPTAKMLSKKCVHTHERPHIADIECDSAKPFESTKF